MCKSQDVQDSSFYFHVYLLVYPSVSWKIHQFFHILFIHPMSTIQLFTHSSIFHHPFHPSTNNSSIHLSIYPFIHLSVYLFISQVFHSSINLLLLIMPSSKFSTHSFIGPSVHSSVCPNIHQSFHISFIHPVSTIRLFTLFIPSFIHPSISKFHQPFHPSINQQTIYPFEHTSIHPFINYQIYPSIHPFVIHPGNHSLSIHTSNHSTHLSISISLQQIQLLVGNCQSCSHPVIHLSPTL